MQLHCSVKRKDSVNEENRKNKMVLYKQDLYYRKCWYFHGENQVIIQNISPIFRYSAKFSFLYLRLCHKKVTYYSIACF